VLLLFGELGAEHKIEEFDCIIERQQSPIVQIGGEDSLTPRSAMRCG
jgi:hypothetical protein